MRQRPRLWPAPLLSLALGSVAAAASLPPGFSETQLAGGLVSPTAMALTPDGRILVCQQGGQLRVIKDGELLDEPFLSLTVNDSGERGLLGIAVDPDFASNQQVYVYYTRTAPGTAIVHNRVSRFTAAGDVAVPGSETVLLDLGSLAGNGIHNGGALHFGQDRKLYVAVGDDANALEAQSLNSLFGKMLRINSDGTIPTDNPFFNQTSGPNRAIWALGLRNPFTFAVQPGSGRIFVNDVGSNSWEEINDGVAGSNYGWPVTEGPTSDPRFRSPFFAYQNDVSTCAVTGGAFYAPATPQFPPEFEGQYLFADFCAGWIKRLDPVTAVATDFASLITFPVDLKVGADGSLFYLSLGGSVMRVQYDASLAPRIASHPSDVTVTVGQPAGFGVSASGAAPLAYQWQRDGADIPGATSPSYTLATTSTSDDGALFRVVVSNAVDSVTSNAARLTVTANSSPSAAISSPVQLQLYAAGDTLAFAGTGQDAEDGPLPASALTWRIDFHHDSHAHPFLPPTSGISSGTFTIPTTGETAANVFYRVSLTVQDSGGLTHTTSTDVVPRTVTLTLATSPGGLQLTLDGQPVTTPFSVQGVVGMQRTLGAPSPQAQGPLTWEFASWSDGGAASHVVVTPSADATYTASFGMGERAPGVGLFGTYFDNPDFTGASALRIDRTVDFEWAGSPAPAIGADTFSVRWRGMLRAKVSGTHTLSTVSDDGVRLFVSGQLLIDNWTDHPPTQDSATIELTAGQLYVIRLDVYDNQGGATARLLWSAPGLAQEVVPQSHLYPHALLVTGSTTLDPGEAAIKARLESQGYFVWLRDAASATAFDAMVQSVVLISPAVATSDIGTRFRPVVNGVVSCRPESLPGLGMTGPVEGSDFGTLAGQTDLTLMIGPRGVHTVTTAPITFGWGVPTASAYVIARSVAELRPLAFVYERGTGLVGGPAPGRRVGLWVEDGAENLNGSGWALFDAAVAWASGR